MGCLKRADVIALQFDANRKVIAIAAALEFRDASVPSSILDADKLNQIPISLDQEMSRHFELSDGLKVRVNVGIQVAQKELFDVSSPILIRRKANGVNHAQ